LGWASERLQFTKIQTAPPGIAGRQAQGVQLTQHGLAQGLKHLDVIAQVCGS